MRVTDDRVVITPVQATAHADGTPVEPEEAPVHRILDAELPLSFNTGQLISQKMPGEVTVDMSAGELAARMRSRCAECVHFSNTAWLKLYNELRHSLNDPSAQIFLNQIRAAVDQVTDAEYVAKHYDHATDEVDIDHALQDLGLCHAMTEIWQSFLKKKYPIIVAPEASCPDDKGPRGEDFSTLFKSRDRAEGRRSGKMYDMILRLAQGTKKIVSGWRRGGNGE